MRHRCVYNASSCARVILMICIFGCIFSCVVCTVSIYSTAFAVENSIKVGMSMRGGDGKRIGSKTDNKTIANIDVVGDHSDDVGRAMDGVGNSISITSDKDGGFSSRIIQIIALLTVLSIAPSILIMVTSFTRIIVSLSIVRNAIGLQQMPPAQVMTSLALFMTFFVMMPTFRIAYETSIAPLMNDEITEIVAWERIQIPFRKFMLSQVSDHDLDLFYNIAKHFDEKHIDGNVGDGGDKVWNGGGERRDGDVIKNGNDGKKISSYRGIGDDGGGGDTKADGFGIINSVRNGNFDNIFKEIFKKNSTEVSSGVIGRTSFTVEQASFIFDDFITSPTVITFPFFIISPSYFYNTTKFHQSLSSQQLSSSSLSPSSSSLSSSSPSSLQANSSTIDRDDVSFFTLIPAFMISELKKAFEIGFLIYLPFLIIDILVSSILMAMGMMMLPPVMVSLPFKLIFFTLVDGWYLVCGGIIKGYM